MVTGRDIAYAIGAVVSSPVWVTNLVRTGKWRTDWLGRFGRSGAIERQGRPRLLIHAVSVGEVNLIRELVRLLDEQGVEVVIAATTNTGHARATQLYGGRHAVVRYPLDFTFAVDRFLDAVKPDAVALVELEVWPTFVERCTARQIPVAVINGRLSERSFRRYRLAKPLLKATFAQLAAAGVQNAEYAKRFTAMGLAADRVRVLDTMKWDTATIADDVPGADELAAEMGIDRNLPVVVAGSTAPGEDKLLIEAHKGWPPGTQLVIAPRKPEWFDQVAEHAPGITRRSVLQHAGADQGPRGEPRCALNLFLLDTVGELRKAYALADVVVVGRSFVKLYGSDMMEPIGLGKPVVIGPNTSDFAHMMAAFQERQAVLVTKDPGTVVAALLDDPERRRAMVEAGRAVIREHQGASRKHADLLRSLLRADNAGPPTPAT